jgi:group I intron endonuclease
MSKIGVYKITSPSNKIYIGSSKNIYKRWDSYKKLRCKSQIKLYNSLLKYSPENHEFKILIECDFDDLYVYENLYSNYYNSLSSNNLNLRIPKFFDKKACISNETIEKMKLNHQSKTNTEWRNNLTKRLKEQNQSIEFRQKISKSKKGIKNNFLAEYNKRISKEDRKLIAKKRIENVKNKNNGQYHTNEFKQKMSERLKGVKLSESHKQKLKEKSGQAKKVICTKTLTIYNSAKEASLFNDINYYSLVKKLTGIRKNNYSLKYYEG